MVRGTCKSVSATSVGEDTYCHGSCSVGLTDWFRSGLAGLILQRENRLTVLEVLFDNRVEVGRSGVFADMPGLLRLYDQ